MGAVGPDPRRRRGGRRRGRGHRRRPGSPPRSTTAASPSCTCPRRCSAWSTPPSAARPASTCPEGKNLVGAFWQPTAVLCDTDAARHAAAAGVAQRAWARWPSTTSSTGDDLAGAAARRARRPRASRIKADAWSRRRARGRPPRHCSTTATRSPTRSRRRAATTCATARRSAIGLVFAAELARALGRIDDERVAEHRRVVGALRPADDAARRARPRRADRAVRPRQEGGRRRTFVLDGPDGVETVAGVDGSTPSSDAVRRGSDADD